MGISLTELTGQIRSRIPGAAGSRPAVRGLPSAMGLEIDGLTLRITEASRSGNSSRIDHVRAFPLELPENADRTDALVLGSAIAKTLAKARFKPGPVVLGIGRSQVILRTVVVPDTGLTGTIAALVRFQVARDLPFRLDEAIIDFQILRKLPARPASDIEATTIPSGAANDSVDRVEVLVAITRQESLEFLRRMTEAAGLSLAAVGWISQANATCLRAASDASALNPGPRALVAIKSEEVGIEILEGRSLLFSRGLPMPSSKDTEPDQWIRSATIEVVRTLHAFGGTPGRTAPESALILGGTGLEEALSAALEVRLGFKVPQVTLSRSQGLDSSEAAAVAGGFSSIGLALGATDPAGLEFDFLNPKRPTPPPDLRKIRLIAGATAAVALLVAVLGIRKTPHQPSRSDPRSPPDRIDHGRKETPGVSANDPTGGHPESLVGRGTRLVGPLRPPQRGPAPERGGLPDQRRLRSQPGDPTGSPGPQRRGPRQSRPTPPRRWLRCQTLGRDAGG